MTPNREAEIRNQAIEDCAHILDQRAQEYGYTDPDQMGGLARSEASRDARKMAAEIRKLKS